MARVSGAEVIMSLPREEIARVYSGKPGCGCGRKGSYSESKGQITRVLNAMRERASEVQMDLWEKDSEGIVGCLSLEDDSRYRWVYIKAL